MAPPAHPVSKVTVLVPAGRRPGVDPLAEHFGAPFKAAIPVAGEPMLGRVVQALLAAPAVGRIVILSQSPDTLWGHPDLAWLLKEPQVSWLSSGNSISASVLGAIETLGDEAAPFLLVTADHALLTPAMIDAFLMGAFREPTDIAIGFVERKTLLARYPQSRRTWIKLKGGWYSGANLFLFASTRVRPALALWQEVEQDRKKAIKLFTRFGIGLFLKAVFRLVSLPRALATAGQRLGLKVRPVILDIAEACIDVDKPEDHALAEQILEGRDRKR